MPRWALLTRFGNASYSDLCYRYSCSRGSTNLFILFAVVPLLFSLCTFLLGLHATRSRNPTVCSRTAWRVSQWLCYPNANLNEATCKPRKKKTATHGCHKECFRTNIFPLPLYFFRFRLQLGLCHLVHCVTRITKSGSNCGSVHLGCLKGETFYTLPSGPTLPRKAGNFNKWSHFI